jgi:AI2M/AI1M-like HNH endonuclease
VPSCKARAIGRKPHCLNLNLQGWNRTLIATAPDGGAAGTGPYSFRGPYPPPGSRSAANRFKGMREAPTSRSIRPPSTERGIAYGARALGRRSPRSSRRRHDRPGRPVTPGTGRRGTGDLTTNEVRYARCEPPKPSWASSENAAEEGHHVRKLADLSKPGQREKPLWVRRMASRRRKTLVLCQQCHEEIHRERPSRRKITA